MKTYSTRLLNTQTWSNGPWTGPFATVKDDMCESIVLRKFRFTLFILNRSRNVQLAIDKVHDAQEMLSNASFHTIIIKAVAEARGTAIGGRTNSRETNKRHRTRRKQGSENAKTKTSQKTHPENYTSKWNKKENNTNGSRYKAKMP